MGGETTAFPPKKSVEDILKAPRRSQLVGSDALGGRSWDCPEFFHARMLELAQSGQIPVTTADKRKTNIQSKPTFQGTTEWKEAVKFGYIHPNLPPPKGLAWKKVTVGYKLIPA